MRATRLQLSLEVSVTGAFTTGLEAYQSGRFDWQRYQDLGAPIAAFFIDEPLTNGARPPPGLSYTTVVDETANWIALVRRDPRFRNVRLMLIEAYPHISSTTIVGLVTDLNDAAAIRGVAGLDGLQIDHAWDGQNAWSGSDMATMRAAAYRRRMEFSIIFYAAMPFQNPTDDCDFRARLSQQWKSYGDNGVDYYGFYPDIYTIQSWDQLPSVTAPESVTCTFMQGAKQWLDSIAIIPPVHPGLHDRICQSQSAIEQSDCEQPTVR
jgi:hypothetical protein